MASEYDSDEMLSQALDLCEQYEEDLFFVTQDKFKNNSAEVDDAEDVLKTAVDVQEMLEEGGPTLVGSDRFTVPKADTGK